jgi:hypothetical protein
MMQVEELTVAAVRSAMASDYELDRVASELMHRSHHNVTALRVARAKVERGAGWRAGPIGQRARDALTRAIERCEADDEIDLTEGAALASSDEIIA